VWDWLEANKQWVFDGFGVAIISGVIVLAGRAIFRPRSSSGSVRQHQRGGSESVNVQIGSIDQGRDK
jgi:hypothetical protein